MTNKQYLKNFNIELTTKQLKLQKKMLFCKHKFANPNWFEESFYDREGLLHFYNICPVCNCQVQRFTKEANYQTYLQQLQITNLEEKEIFRKKLNITKYLRDFLKEEILDFKTEGKIEVNSVRLKDLEDELEKQEKRIKFYHNKQLLNDAKIKQFEINNFWTMLKLNNLKKWRKNKWLRRNRNKKYTIRKSYYLTKKHKEEE